MKAVPAAPQGPGDQRTARSPSQTNEIIDFPASYDGTKPFPLLIALHACGNPNTQWEGLVKGSPLESDYVRLMPNTSDSGQCWNNYANNSARILKQYDEVLAKYCVDTNHVFGVGHSSGAQMLVNMLAHKSDAQHLNFKAMLARRRRSFQRGDTDSGALHRRQDGQPAKCQLRQGCSQPNSAPPTGVPIPRRRTRRIMGCQSSGMTVDPGCIVYDNCTVPTIWCAHNDPNYSGTQHGVPCFGIKAIY